MWRVQGFVGRALHRCFGNNPLRLPQAHHVEDEVINGSSVLSTSRHTSDSSYSVSSQQEDDGEWRKKRRAFHFEYAGLPRYTALDAVGWGVAAALFMQICRRIHSQLSSGSEQSPIPGALTAASTLHRCGYRILLETLSERDVLARGRTRLSLQRVPESHNREQASAQGSGSSSTTGNTASPPSSSGQDHQTADCSATGQQSSPLNQDAPIPEESLVSASCHLQNDGSRDKKKKTKQFNDQDASDEGRLAGATLNLKHVGDSSVPVILNIIGLESAKSENYEEAFTCFLAAAQQGYSKAQFNVGVCYEKGRGVCKDREKAMHFYWQAAAGGHRQAQYRYAKLALTARGQQSLEELNTAIDLLERSAAAGLTKAQVCLASVYSQEPVRDRSKSVQYLKMAAESGDGKALLYLGECYENGLGVQQNLRTAIDYYKKAAQAGNKQAKSLLMPPNCTDNKKDAVLRSICSAPCFSLGDRQLQQPLSSPASHVPPCTGHHLNRPLLPHSWSAGSLSVPVALSSRPRHLHDHSTEGGICHWTVGIG